MVSSEVISLITSALSQNGEQLRHVAAAAGKGTPPHGPDSVYINGVLAVSDTYLRFVRIYEVGRFKKHHEIKVQDALTLAQISALQNDSMGAPPTVHFMIEPSKYEFFPVWDWGLPKDQLLEVLNRWASLAAFLEMRAPQS